MNLKLRKELNEKDKEKKKKKEEKKKKLRKKNKFGLCSFLFFLVQPTTGRRVHTRTKYNTCIKDYSYYA